VGSELGKYPQKCKTHTSVAIEANNFKLGTQLVFEEKLVKTTTKTYIGDFLNRTPKISGPL